MRAIATQAFLLLLGVSTVRAQGAPAAKPAALQWGPAPAAFPKGAKLAVVSGDPGKAAPFVVELSMPAGYRIPPHFHPTDETIEVKKGTFMVGMGDTFAASGMKPMKLGDQGQMPAGAHHFATAKGATIVSVSAMGPFTMTYVNPADDPRQHSANP